MDLDLTKDQPLDLSKENSASGNEINNVEIGLGWEPAESGDTYDLDASVVVFDNGTRKDVCYYNMLKVPGISHSGDDVTGGNSDTGPDEIINVELDKIQGDRAEIILTLYNAKSKGQKLSEVRDAFIEIGGDVKHAKFVVSDADNVQGGAMHFGTLQKGANGWTFTPHARDLGMVDLNGAIQAVS